mgnify:FL=1
MIRILTIVSLIAWGVFFYTSAKANEYTEAVVGHVIQNHDKIDHSALLQAELTRLAHRNSIDLINILQDYLPAILDGVAADLRQKSDLEYKCSLQPDNYKNNECK